MAVWSAAVRVAIDGIVAGKQASEDAQLIMRVGRSKVVHVALLVAHGDTDGRQGAEGHVGVILQWWQYLNFTHQELYAGDIVGYLKLLMLKQSLNELLCAPFRQETDVERHKVRLDNETLALAVNSILWYD